MTPNAIAIAGRLIAKFEGCRLAPYQDEAGVWTVAYGNTFYPDGTRVRQGDPHVTQSRADEILAWTVGKFAKDVALLVSFPLNDNQNAALVSFSYNEGAGWGGLKTSRLLAYVNAGRLDLAAAEFPKWVYAGGRMSAGLVARRKVERAVFEGLAALAADAAPSDADRLNDAELNKIREG